MGKPAITITPKQEALVQALAMGARSITQAADMAGMHPVHAGQVLKKPNVQQRLEILRNKQAARKTDKARAVKDAALETIHDRIRAGDASDPLLVGAAKVGHEISLDEPIEDNLQQEASSYRRVMLRVRNLAFRAGIRAAIDFFEAKVSVEDVLNAASMKSASAAPMSDNSQYVNHADSPDPLGESTPEE